MYLSNRAVMVGRGFNPGNLLGIVAFYDISKIKSLFVERTGASATTPAEVDGVVGTVRDLSGNGNHLVALSDASRPILRSDGGRYWLEFDGVDDRIRCSFMISQPFVRVSGVRLVSPVVNKQVFGGVSANASALWTPSPTAIAIYSGVILSAGGGSIASGTDYVFTERHNGASSRLAVNNNSYITGDAGTNVGGGITVADSSIGGNVMEMRFYGCAAYNADIDDDGITKLRTYFAARAGVTL